MKMLVSKMPLVIGEFYETVLKPMALEKGGITAMTIVPLGALAVKTSPLLIRSYIPELQDAGVVNGSGDIIDLDRLQVFALDYLKNNISYNLTADKRKGLSEFWSLAPDELKSRVRWFG